MVSKVADEAGSAGSLTATRGLLAAGGWLLKPAVEVTPSSLAASTAGVRLLLGVMWLFNAAWKVPPSFGEADRSGLFVFTSYAVSHPVFAPYSWFVEQVVLKAFVPFGWAVLAMETVLAVLLLSGSFVRLAATLGLAQSLAIGLSVARAPNEWPWSYLLMVAVHLLVLFGGAGRFLAVDALRAGRADGRVLSLVWGGLAVVMGLGAVVVSAVKDPFGPRGVNLELAGLQFGLGSYNVIGGTILIVVGGLVLSWSLIARSRSRCRLAWAAGVLGALAALVLTLQIGFSPPLLGGNATSAAFFLTLAAVGAGLASWATGDHRNPEPTSERTTR